MSAPPPSPLHILQAADYGGPYAGSFVPWLRAVAGEARSRGHHVEVLFTDVARGRPWLELLDEAGVPVGFARGEAHRALRSAVAGHLPASGSAVIHTHFSAFDMPAVRVARARAETAVVWHVHTRLGSGARARAAHLLKFATANRRVDHVLTVTDQIAATARSRGARADRVVTVPNSIDLTRNPARTPERRAAARDRLGTDGRPVVLHFGRDWRLKGGDVLLEAVAMLVARGIALQVLTIGGGGGAREQAARLGIAESVRTIDPVANAAELYAAADVFVLSGRAEGVYSLLEAAAAGAGIVASAIPGQAELAERIPGVRLCELRPASVASAIDEVLARDPETASAEAEAARAWVTEHADVTVAARAMVDLYEQVSRGGA